MDSQYINDVSCNVGCSIITLVIHNKHKTHTTMNRFLIVCMALFCLAAAVQADETNVQYKDCGHNEIKSFFVTGGNPNQKSCVIHKHSKNQLRISFVANENTGNKINTRFICNLGGIELGWPGIDGTDACQGHGLSCPLTKGQTYNYHLDFNLGDDVPTVSLSRQSIMAINKWFIHYFLLLHFTQANVTATVRLENGHGGDLLCGRMHISLQN